jgi:hypothetical protein
MLAILSVNHIIIDIRLINEGPQSCVTVDSRHVTCWGDDKSIPGRGTSWSSRRCPFTAFLSLFSSKVLVKSDITEVFLLLKSKKPKLF